MYILKGKKKLKQKLKYLIVFILLIIKKKNDISISAIPGLAGLEPTLIIVRRSKKLLIANKESIICSYNLIKRESYINKTKIIPVDSEHYSIFKLIRNHNYLKLKNLYNCSVDLFEF